MSKRIFARGTFRGLTLLVMAACVLAVALVLVGAYQANQGSVAFAEHHEEGEGEGHHGAGDSDGAIHIGKAVAVLRGTKGNEKVHGVVLFTQMEEGVLIEAQVNGLTPGKHGFHIHQYGDISAEDGTSAGGHYNPAGVEHAMPDSEKRHVGDLGNIEADENGHAMYKKLDEVVQLHGQHAVLSRAVVVHAGEDKFTQPTGGAGGRVAVGVIGLAKSE